MNTNQLTKTMLICVTSIISLFGCTSNSGELLTDSGADEVGFVDVGGDRVDADSGKSKDANPSEDVMLDSISEAASDVGDDSSTKPVDPNKPLVGAIRWDAWTGATNEVGIQVERTLGPNEYHYKLPFYAVETGHDSVRIEAITQDVIDQEIEYAAYAGLDYFAYVWYPSSMGLDQARNLYLSSGKKNLINFCLIIEDSRFSREIHLPDVISFMRMGTYQKVMGNRPLLYFLGSRGITTEQIASLRTSAAKAGLGNPYVVLMRSDADDIERKQELGMDALSLYAVSWVKNHPPGAGPNGAPFADLAATAADQWDWIANTKGQAVVPTVTTGWDVRPRFDNPVTWMEVKADAWAQTATAAEVASHTRAAIEFVKNNSSKCESKAIIMYAWNEFDEGGYICPNLPKYAGTERIDALRSVLVK